MWRMQKPKVYVTRSVRPDVLERMAAVCDVGVWTEPGRCPADVLSRAAADAVTVVGTDAWTESMMAAAPRLKHIALTAVGYDMVDLAAATARGILVTNTAGSLTDTVADLVLGLMLAAARRIPELERWTRAGRWTSPGVTPMGLDVYGKTLGIVGLGRIGQAVAERARGFRMRLLCHDSVRREAVEARLGCEFVPLERLLDESDFVTLHVPLGAGTQGMMGAAQFARMKSTAFLINTSRGPVVDEAALIAALRDGRIAGAGLDVYEHEPVDLRNPLLSMENVVTVPHVGSATEATRQAMVDLAVENALAVLQGKPPLTPVNPEVLGKRGRG
jgi:glyoxylate reductase